jgi:hypothetical protein
MRIFLAGASGAIVPNRGLVPAPDISPPLEPTSRRDGDAPMSKFRLYRGHEFHQTIGFRHSLDRSR